ncbi:hypothetical protein ES708_19248 [subsurface metagenome]
MPGNDNNVPKHNPNVDMRVTDPVKTPSVPRYNCGVNVTIPDIQKHRRFYNYFIQYWRHNRRILDFSDPSNTILSFVPQLCFVPCFLLAYTCCRVGELSQIKISDILDLKKMKIKSSKSKHIRYVPPFADFKPYLRKSINPKTMIMVVSYDHLRHSIVQAKKRGKLPHIPSALDVTHSFRHYEATYLNSKGVDIDIISEKLGHLNKNTTRIYIH